MEQPLKIPYVAATVLFANAESHEVGALFLERLTPLVQEAVNAGQWRDFKLLLRLLCCLGPAFAQDGVMPILDELFNRAADLQTESQEDVSVIVFPGSMLMRLGRWNRARQDHLAHHPVSSRLQQRSLYASASLRATRKDRNCGFNTSSVRAFGRSLPIRQL